MSADVEDVRQRLATVPDPCSLGFGNPVDICSLGLVDQVEVEDGDVRIGLVLTDVACVHYGALRSYISDAVGALPGVRTVAVRMVPDVVWTPDRAAGVFLGLPERASTGKGGLPGA